MDEIDLQSLLDQQDGYVQPTYDYAEPTFDTSYYQSLFSPEDYTSLYGSNYSDVLGALDNIDSTGKIDVLSLLNASDPTQLAISYPAGSLSDRLGYLTGQYAPATSYLDTSGGVFENPLDYMTSNIYDTLGQGGESAQTFVRDNRTGEIVGYLDDSGNLQYYGNMEGYAPQGTTQDRMSAAGKLASAAASTAGKTTAQKIAEKRNQQELKQIAAEQAFQNSAANKALSMASGLGTVLQALIAKKKGATTSSRGNEGQAFAPTYIPSSAPKTVYQKKASGGSIKNAGGLLSVAEQLMNALGQATEHKGLIRGDDGGQDDVVDVKAAPGEYVMDAEIVSALGDGNNEAGAKKLDNMRVNIRKHKRQGGLSSIPPKAKQPEQYMKGK